MFRSALFVTATIFLSGGLWLLSETRFLIPYRALLIYQYGLAILIFVAALFLNTFTAVYLFCRKFLLKDTGRKLVHLEKQLRSGVTIDQELARFLED